MQTVQAGKEKYHAIVSKRDGKKWNRRQAYRQYLGLDEMLSIESTRANRSVVVKDISSTGVSFAGFSSVSMSSGNFLLLLGGDISPQVVICLLYRTSYNHFRFIYRLLTNSHTR